MATTDPRTNWEQTQSQPNAGTAGNCLYAYMNLWGDCSCSALHPFLCQRDYQFCPSSRKPDRWILAVQQQILHIKEKKKNFIFNYRTQPLLSHLLQSFLTKSDVSSQFAKRWSFHASLTIHIETLKLIDYVNFSMQYVVGREQKELSQTT